MHASDMELSFDAILVGRKSVQLQCLDLITIHAIASFAADAKGTLGLRMTGRNGTFQPADEGLAVEGDTITSLVAHCKTVLCIGITRLGCNQKSFNRRIDD
jgi:hypothetical protein